MEYVGSNIVIDGNSAAGLALDALGVDQIQRANRAADTYERHIMRLITQVRSKAAGRAVLHAIGQYPGRTMIIKPYLKDTVNAGARATDLAHATRRGRRSRGRGSDRGTGTGSDTVVSFSTGTFISTELKGTLWNANPPTTPGFLPDEVLLHEMVHGLRHMAGLRHTRRVPFQRGYDTMEEFFAVLIANIYHSEWGRPGLRLDHGVAPAFIGERDFLRLGRNRAHLRQLRRQQPGLFERLRGVNATFNPTRLLIGT